MNALRFYWLVAASGGVLMALEILSSRLLAPYFGSSVYVWGSIIGVFLACLSLGYALGGRLADRFPSLSALGRLVIAAGLAQIVLLLAGETLSARLGELTGGTPTGTLLTTLVLFGPVTVLLGMISPWAVRLAADDLDALGHIAGRLYALSAIGSLVGTLAATFVFIPWLGLNQILGLLLLITAGTGALAILGSGDRLGLSLAVVLALAGGLALPTEPHLEGVTYRRMTPDQTLEVTENEDIRYLKSDGTLQAGIHLSDGSTALSYARLASAGLLIQPETKRVLMLGLGGGNFAQVLRRARPEMTIDVVEIDPAVVDTAQRFFGFSLGPGDRLFVEDARRFLDGTDEEWDLILADTYIGRNVPFHLATVEFFQLVHQRIAPGGVLGLNLAGGLGQPFPRAILRGIGESFAHLVAFRSTRLSNVVVFATDRPLLRPEDMMVRAQELDANLDLDLPLTTIVGRQRVEVDLEALDAPRLTDDYAPVERLVYSAH